MKYGAASDRATVARFAREQRARFPTLQGGWSRRLWNHAVQQACENKLAILTRARKAGVVTMRQIHEDGQAAVREITRRAV